MKTIRCEQCSMAIFIYNNDGDVLFEYTTVDVDEGLVCSFCGASIREDW